MRIFMSLFLWMAPPAALIATAPLGRHPTAASPTQLEIDLNGDGVLDEVRLVRAAGAYWLDAYVASADGLRPIRSTTRVAESGAGLTIRAADVDHDRRADVIVRDGEGRVSAWVSNGIAFDRAPDAGATALAASGAR